MCLCAEFGSILSAVNGNITHPHPLKRTAQHFVCVCAPLCYSHNMKYYHAHPSANCASLTRYAPASDERLFQSDVFQSFRSMFVACPSPFSIRKAKRDGSAVQKRAVSCIISEFLGSERALRPNKSLFLAQNSSRCSPNALLIHERHRSPPKKIRSLLINVSAVTKCST